MRHPEGACLSQHLGEVPPQRPAPAAGQQHLANSRHVQLTLVPLDSRVTCQELLCLAAHYMVLSPCRASAPSCSNKKTRKHNLLQHFHCGSQECAPGCIISYFVHDPFVYEICMANINYYEWIGHDPFVYEIY